MSELTAEDPLNFNSIDDQRAFAIEAGLRGTLGNWMAWDVAAFDIRAENEIINMGDTASIVSGSVFENVDNTTHKGVEAAIDVKLAPGMFERQNAALTWRSVYHFSDFRFGESTGSLQGNRIAGIPMHHYRGELRYDVAEKMVCGGKCTGERRRLFR